MSDIDWSKAPEWSGAVVESASGNLYWVEQFGTKSRRQSLDSSEPDGDYIADMTLPEHAWRLAENRQKAWTGTGLPPVGTVCECQDNEFVWHEGVIVYVGKDCGENVAVMQCKNELLWGAAGEFRPIRTPEQIAAEEREKAIDEMYSLTRTSSSQEVINAQRRVCEDLYDAGYRKTEAP